MIPSRDVGLLHLEADALALEVRFAEVEAGWTVPDATRDLYPHERTAAVRFAALDRQVEDVAGRLLAAQRTVREAVVAALANLPVASRVELLAVLRDLTDPTTGTTLEGTADAVRGASDDVRDALLAAVGQAADEVREEAARQGVPDALLPAPGGPDDDQRRALELTARRVALRPYEVALDVAQEVAQRESASPGPVAEARALVAGAVADSSERGLLDVARQAAGEAQSIGRTIGARAVPEPVAAYASELLDRNTCGPCGTVDGRRYDTLAHALEDYPGAGGFVFCEGGARCRGTLVLVHRTEASPTVDVPGEPQGPSDPPLERPSRPPF